MSPSATPRFWGALAVVGAVAAAVWVATEPGPGASRPASPTPVVVPAAPPAPPPPIRADAAGSVAAPAPARPATADAADLVDILEVDPSFLLDVRYATENNFLQRKVYPVARVLLRRSVAERLGRVQKRLRAEGLRLKVFDGYRPLAVQRTMWELLPDPKYVGDPRKGSKHNRGAAVDVTLADRAGRALDMPTDYDDFTERAAADAEDVGEEARANRKRLQDAMTAEGFEIFPSEWWHFNDPDWAKYDVLDVPLTTPPARR